MIVTNNIIKELNTDDGHIGEIRYSREIMKCNDRAHATIEILKKMNANNIVHVGCCNHVLEIDRLIESQRHLHLLLQEHFDKVVGFDINEAAIAYFNEKTHRGGIYYNDLTTQIQQTNEIIEKEFGVNEKDNLTILVPDVIEHTSSPVDFLRKISENYGYGNNKIVISVPNAYSLGSIKDVIVRNKECINMDHKYTFTPTTLLKVMCMAGIIPDNIYFVGQYKLAKIIKSPLLGVTLLATGHFLQ